MNSGVQDYMMNLGMLPQQNAVGPPITTNTNPANGSTVTTGETTTDIDNTIPEVYGPGTGAETSTMNVNKDESPMDYID